MKLSKLIDAIDAAVVGPTDIEVTDLQYDSRAVVPGSLFFAVKGLEADGHDFAGQAVESGASAVVCERELKIGVTQVVVGDSRAAMAEIATKFFGDPSAELDLIGITGTNGKTTTAYLCRQVLESCGQQCGLLGTVGQVVAGESRPASHTTPESVDLQRTLREMVEGGDRACAMEVSSHALHLRRVAGAKFAAAIFTNLTQDHLDFHRDLEEYFLAKRSLFIDVGGHHPRISVINADDREYGARLAGELEATGQEFVTYGIDSDAHYSASSVALGKSGSSFQVECAQGDYMVSTGLPGRFNVYNSLAALAVTVELGFEPAKVAAALAQAGGAPGRFQSVRMGQDFSVLIDYAHTPDSLENVLEAARGITEGRILTVFGCGGDRDRGKRPQMGEIAERLSDLVYITSDNPRSEDPDAIIAEIVAGTSGPSERLLTIADRREAIRVALGEASAGDTVVIAGKGHEQGQEFEGGRKIDFDDTVVAGEELKQLLAQGREPT